MNYWCDQEPEKPPLEEDVYEELQDGEEMIPPPPGAPPDALPVPKRKIRDEPDPVVKETVRYIQYAVSADEHLAFSISHIVNILDPIPLSSI